MGVIEFLFFKADNTRLFLRSDAESANWTVHERTMTALFPYVPGKEIERGMRIGFDDPSGGGFQFFEIRKVRNYAPDHYQEITAEHIVISELTDCHVAEMEISNATAQNALGSVLSGTGWSVGTSTASGTSSADLSMGSVWQDVCVIRDNWNVILTPRITYNAGGITGRYIDIAPNEATWRGIRLSINKNADEMGVTYDDTSLLTAMYGYGASKDDVTSDDPVPVDFADVVWTATADHPAKPSGQTYIEDPTATALYGRNGRPRFGFYQNSDIRDGSVLLEKTWASLKNQNEPTVTIDCTIRDLYRLGYADQPLRLNDMAIIDIEPIGAHLERQIIQMDVDLLDPSATRVTIGTYIPNIIYINHEVAVKTGGGGGVGGSGRSKDSETKEEAVRHEFEADINANNYQISLRAYQNDLDTTNGQLRQAQIDITAQGVRITAAEGNITNNSTEIATTKSELAVEAGKITQIVTAVGENGQVTAASIITAIDNDTSTVTISADKIDLNGLVTATEFQTALASIDNLVGDLNVVGDVTVGGDLEAGSLSAESYSDYKVDGTSIGLGNVVKSFGTPTSSGGQISIPWTKLDGTAGTPINFNIADTQYFIDSVAAAEERGKNSVRITDVDGTDYGDPSYNVNPASITATASNGATYNRSLYLTQGSWNSSHKKAVNIRVGTTSGNLIGRLWIDAPSVSVGKPYLNQPAQGKIRAVCVVNGQTYYGDTHNVSEYS